MIRSGGELVYFGAEAGLGFCCRLRGVQPWQPDAPLALDIVDVDNGAETGGEQERAGGGDAEWQCDNRGGRGGDGRKRE